MWLNDERLFNLEESSLQRWCPKRGNLLEIAWRSWWKPWGTPAGKLRLYVPGEVNTKRLKVTQRWQNNTPTNKTSDQNEKCCRLTSEQQSPTTILQLDDSNLGRNMQFEISKGHWVSIQYMDGVAQRLWSRNPESGIQCGDRICEHFPKQMCAVTYWTKAELPIYCRALHKLRNWYDVIKYPHYASSHL